MVVDSRGLARNVGEEEAGRMASVCEAVPGASKALARPQVEFPDLGGSGFCAFFPTTFLSQGLSPPPLPVRPSPLSFSASPSNLSPFAQKEGSLLAQALAPSRVLPALGAGPALPQPLQAGLLHELASFSRSGGGTAAAEMPAHMVSGSNLSGNMEILSLS